MILRDYQEECLQNLREAFKTHRSVILQLATGAGKTAVAAAVAQGLSSRGRSLLALVHRRELVEQFAGTLEKIGLEGRYGIIASGRAPTPWARFQVASIQTLHRRELDLNPRYVVVDECHHAKAKTWEEVLSRFPKSKILGLTATPGRLDGKPLGDHFDHIVEGPSMQWLVAHGWLAPVTLKYVSRGILTKGVRKTAGDYNRVQLGEQLNRKVIAAPVRAFFKYASDRRTIFFAINRRDSEQVAESLRARGVRAAHVDGKTTKRFRDQIMAEFRRGDIQVLCNVDIVSEGTDVPQCDCVMIGLPTLSVVRYLQMNGRPMRPDHGRDALSLDLVGNFWRFGRPDDPRKWYLNLNQYEGSDSDVTVSRANMKVCVYCATVYEGWRTQCPACGREKVLPTPEHLDVDLLDDDEGSMDPKPRGMMSNVRKDLRDVIRNGRGRAGIQEIRQKYGLPARWETNAISALNL